MEARWHAGRARQGHRRRISSRAQRHPPGPVGDGRRNGRALRRSPGRMPLPGARFLPLPELSFSCMFSSRTTASSRPARSSPTTMRRCRSRAASGKRLKIKATAVLLRLREPSPTAADRRGAEASPPSSTRISCGTFRATANSVSIDLAREYYGASPAPARGRRGRAARSRPRRCIFYKRGKGRLSAGAAAGAQGAALASVERKKREGEQMAAWGDELRARRPARRASARSSTMLLYQPDKNTLEWKSARRGVRHGAEESGRRCSPRAARSLVARLPLQRVPGAGVSQGHLRLPPAGALAPCARACRAPTSARSRSTTRRRPKSTMRSRCASCRTATTKSASISPRRRSAFRARSPLDAAARARLSTVYMPGRKITMLPDDVRGRVHAGGRPQSAGAVAVRRSRAPTGRCSGRDARRSRADRRQPAARCDRRSVRRRSAADRPDPPWTTELRVLVEARAARWCGCAWQGGHRAHRLQLPRRLGRDDRRSEAGRVRIVPRPRGSPLDKLIAELMIFVNSTGASCSPTRAGRGPLPDAVGRQGEDEHAPGEHQGLGRRTLPVVELAASPLQRSRESAAAARDARWERNRRTPRTTPSSSRRSPISRRPTRSYAEFQDRMEHYWCLRWLAAGAVSPRPPGTVIRDTLVRFDQLPLVVRLADLPALARGNAGPDRDRSHRPRRGHARCRYAESSNT